MMFLCTLHRVITEWTRTKLGKIFYKNKLSLQLFSQIEYIFFAKRSRLLKRTIGAFKKNDSTFHKKR